MTVSQLSLNLNFLGVHALGPVCLFVHVLQVFSQKTVLILIFLLHYFNQFLCKMLQTLLDVALCKIIVIVTHIHYS